jgi:hypothetical protein
MTDGQIVRFKIGDGFPADDQLARWMTVCAMALNDLLLVNRWLVPRLEEKVPSESYEDFYLSRSAAAHLFEVAIFLRESDRLLTIREFVVNLDPQTQAHYRSLVELAKDGSGKFHGQLKHARNTFFHYPRMLPQADDYEHLKRALEAHADDEREQDIRRGEIRDIPPAITGFRSMFADDVATEMLLPENTEQEYPAFVGNLAEYSGKLLKFVKIAFNAYTHTRPEGTWEIEVVSLGASSSG